MTNDILLGSAMYNQQRFVFRTLDLFSYVRSSDLFSYVRSLDLAWIKIS